MMHRGVTAACLLGLLALLAAALPLAGSPVAASPSAASAAKKLCKTVTKKVHGKKTKVKVCKTVKAKPTPTPTATSLPADQEATSLADAIYSASTDAARTQAILDAMRSLHVSVFTGSGTQIVPGTAQNPSDFYLYDFEVTALAAGIGGGEAIPLSQVVTTFSALGIKPATGALDAATVQRALADAVNGALQARSDPSSLPILLLRDLGMHHSPSYDLAQPAGGSAINLDPLQSFLLMAETLLPLMTVGGSAADRIVVRAPITQTGPCDFKTDTSTKTLLGLLALAGSQIWKGLSTGLSEEIAALQAYVTKALGASLGAVASVSAEVIDLIHMNILAATVDVTASPTTEQQTHYGPPGHEAALGVPGKELDFTVHVEMTADLGQTLISCGPFVGLKFPPKGPIKGVSVKWEDDLLSPALDKYGTVSFNPADQTTGVDGNSTLIFKPNSEVVPGIGKEIVQNGTVLGNAAYQSAYANFKIEGVGITAGFVLENVYPKQGVFNWEVSRHAPRGFQFTGEDVRYHACNPGGCVTADLTYAGHVCGESPYAQPWIFSDVYTETRTGSDAGVSIVPVSFPAALQPNAWWQFPGGQDYDHRQWELMPGTSGNPTMRLTWSPVAPFSADTPTDQTVPVTEDMSCPSPTP